MCMHDVMLVYCHISTEKTTQPFDGILPYLINEKIYNPKLTIRGKDNSTAKTNLILEKLTIQCVLSTSEISLGSPYALNNLLK